MSCIVFRRKSKRESWTIEVVVAVPPRMAPDDPKALQLALDRARELAVPAIRFVRVDDAAIVNGRPAGELGVKALRFEAVVSRGDR